MSNMWVFKIIVTRLVFLQCVTAARSEVRVEVTCGRSAKTAKGSIRGVIGEIYVRAGVICISLRMVKERGWRQKIRALGHSSITGEIDCSIHHIVYTMVGYKRRVGKSYDGKLARRAGYQLWSKAFYISRIMREDLLKVWGSESKLRVRRKRRSTMKHLKWIPYFMWKITFWFWRWENSWFVIKDAITLEMTTVRTMGLYSDGKRDSLSKGKVLC